jgi:preprotein translocase subunit SecE
MARARSAGKGSGGGSRRRRKTPSSSSSGSAAPSPRPRTQQRKEKQGTVTKSVQRNRGSQFLSEVIAELRKVSWPGRAQLAQGTAVVLIVVAIVTVYLAIIDEIFGRLIDSIF